MKKIALVLLFCSAVGFGQQDAQFTQYMHNTININPAYAGSRGVMSVFGLYRTQWVGLDGAPKTGTLSVNTPLNNSNLGLGVSLVNDRIGPTTENNIAVDLSYSIQTSAEAKLSFGIKGSGNIFNLDPNKLTPEHQGDPQFADFKNKFTPNIGAGVYYHSDKGYVGLSVPNFIETRRYDDNETAIFKELINYYLIAGYVFNLDRYEMVQFKPAVLAKMVHGSPLQVDVSANFMFNEKFVAGVSYRWSAALSAMAGFQVNKSMYIGYAYDRETTKLNNYNSGSHEIFLRFEFMNKYSRITSPRFF
ncbi:PorP/SprF family type IX secretion system membrane protein [Flavobacterium foetidum]|uniref:PorP/SprF family type IX secretion system membrane protein n=1 Tax=Flavobacterium foetidum TaxID=2026681 RepID=UPI0010752398|nr:type IX secretion system membrane protein PorP/SprF [Flavobacterium foetidum]KAF2517138.1 type IX secretion system membrane protein PorP/SprF [Flavobacterium foetidum]